MFGIISPVLKISFVIIIHNNHHILTSLFKQDMAKVMQGFERESAKMDMTGEMMEDTLDAALGESDDEEESNQVNYDIFVVYSLSCWVN